LLLALAPAAPVPKGEKGVLYFPTKIGAKWVYSTWDSERVEVVTAVEEKDGAKLVTVGYQSRDGVVSTNIVSVSEKGLAVVAWLDDLGEPLWLLKLPHAAGSKWDAVIDLPGRLHLKGAMADGGPDRVLVPAGEFRAIRITSNFPSHDRKIRVVKTVWYAPRVGKVKEVRGDTVEVLKSFTPGED
jgi:hypothetical protein